MANKKTTKAADAAEALPKEDLTEAELAHPTVDQYQETEHKHGMPLPRNKRYTGDSAHQLSAAEVAEIHGAEVIAANEAKAREIRKNQRGN